MNRLSTKERAQIIACLVERNSIRSTCRMTGAAKGTVLRLLAEVGTVCKRFQDETFRDLPCKRIECDEIWSFVGMKARNVPEEKKDEFGLGDVWTFTAICADTKLVPSWLVGERNADDARLFLEDLALRLKSRVQLTTDGHRMYLSAVESAFGDDVDFAILQKLYSTPAGKDAEARYSPGSCTAVKKEKVSGKPNMEKASTSFVERQNLTMRMSMRRFTRLTNAFSKKVQNLEHAVALHFMYYNFCRVHQTLRVTPAMEAGVADHVWEIEEVVALLDASSK